MQQMRWSWRDLTGDTGGVPTYVQRFCWDISQIKAAETARRNNQPPNLRR